MNLADQTLYENHSKGEMVLAEYDAFLEWTYKKGLLCAEDYYYFANPICPETKESEEDYLEGARRWEMWFEKYDICPIRYSEAKKQERGRNRIQWNTNRS